MPVRQCGRRDGILLKLRPQQLCKPDNYKLPHYVPSDVSDFTDGNECMEWYLDDKPGRKDRIIAKRRSNF